MVKANLNMSLIYLLLFGGVLKFLNPYLIYLKTPDFYIPVAVLNYLTQWRWQLFTHIILYFFLSCKEKSNLDSY